MPYTNSLPEQFSKIQKQWDQLISFPTFGKNTSGSSGPTSQPTVNTPTKSYDTGLSVDNAYTATDSFDATDFMGAAHITFLSSDYTTLKGLISSKKVPLSSAASRVITSGLVKVDLVIMGIDYQYTEFSKISPHIGETFSATYYGKSPIILNVRGKLVDTSVSNGKSVFMELYTKVFRASRVAMNKVAPVIVFQGAAAIGCFLGVNVSEGVASEDTVDIGFQFLVFSLEYDNPDNTGRSTKVRIEYDRTKAVKRTDLQYPDYGPKDIVVNPSQVTVVPSPVTNSGTLQSKSEVFGDTQPNVEVTKDY